MDGEMTNWEFKLSRAVAPIHSEPLRMPSDARAYILSLPPGTGHHDDWERAADLLMAAVGSASEVSNRALLLHRLLAPR